MNAEGKITRAVTEAQNAMQLASDAIDALRLRLAHKETEVERLQSSVRAQVEVTASVSSSLRNANERIRELESERATWRDVVDARIKELEVESDSRGVLCIERGQTINKLLADRDAAQKWRDAIMHECAMIEWAPSLDDDPKSVINKLIAWHQDVALDPKVSEGARAMLVKARNDTIDAAYKVADDVLPYKNKRIRSAIAVRNEILGAINRMKSTAADSPNDSPKGEKE